MNGEDKTYLEGQIEVLKAVMSEKWESHDKRSKDLSDSITAQFTQLNANIALIFDELKQRPCVLHQAILDQFKIDIQNLKVQVDKTKNIPTQVRIQWWLISLLIAGIVSASMWIIRGHIQ